MNAVCCSHCSSIKVTIVSTDEARGLVTIRCVDCGQNSEIPTDRFTVDLGDLPVE